MNMLLIFVPLAYILDYQHLQDSWVFISCCLGIIPLAGFMGKATEYLSEKLGDGPGGLLNATFGNACELILAFSALRAGYIDVVEASITGSIIGNILLVLGFSMLAGGLRFQKQRFNRRAATTSATLLALAAISLTVPAVYHMGPHRKINEVNLALVISTIQILTYVLSLIFSLKTHKYLYVRPVDQEAEEALGIAGWSTKKSIAVLLISTVLVAFLSELLVHTVEETAKLLGMNSIFIGVILIAIVGNAAEHSTAILMALKNKMDLSINIALGSSTQIALFVAPTLVFTGYLIGKPMDLCFSGFEVLSVVVSVIILGFIATDGECNWLEGAQLLAIYAILGSAFYFS